jgi:predicted DNA binding CopG/RHH family protein
MRKKRQYQVLGDVEFSIEDSQHIEDMINQSEEDLRDVNVNFRWKKDKVDLIKDAAKTKRIPYQTYIKQIILKQALKDLKASKQSEIIKPKTQQNTGRILNLEQQIPAVEKQKLDRTKKQQKPGLKREVAEA